MRQEPLQFEVVDQVLEKRRLQNLKSKNAILQKPRPQLCKLDMYLSENRKEKRMFARAKD